MSTNGYIIIDGEKWLVQVRYRKTRRAIRHRKTVADGEHLEDVQTCLEQPEHAWLLDALRHGTTVYLPLETS